jgi:transcriptional regulator with XRE-family HTH domain
MATADILRDSARFLHPFVSDLPFDARMLHFSTSRSKKRAGRDPAKRSMSDVMESADRQSQSETLSTALRLIRNHRRLRAADVAKSMNMALRSYEHFESGGGRINIERVHRFAEVTDSDPHAILAALALGSPAFALRCADNKLATILAVVLQEFDEEAGDAISELESLTIINTFTKALRELAAQSVRRESAAEAWLEERRHRLLSPASDDASTGNGAP